MTQTPDFRTMDTATLVQRFNEATGRSVKPGSYTRAYMIQVLTGTTTPTPTEDPVIYAATPEPITFEEAPGGVGYPAPAPVVEGSCPFCGGAPENQTAAGEEGTFMGDSCNLCHSCGKTYNVFTKAEVPNRPSKKRVVLNPQGKINAKTAAMTEAGFKLDYDRHNRLWLLSEASGGPVVSMKSKLFALESPDSLVAYARKALRGER